MRARTETHLHFVGIGGIGMSGIAEVLLNQGYIISGSDVAESGNTKRLQSLGAKIVIGHQSGNVEGSHAVVISSAIRSDNPEVVQAKKLRIPVIPRAEMLGELMRDKVGIAVAGSHGKTTTTSILATILTHARLDPTLIIGGIVDSLGGNAKLGQGKLVVAEADESDGSFLHLPATYSIITNIDNDHLDHFGDQEKLENAFINFGSKIPFYGTLVLCQDDPAIARCLDRFTKPYRTYGLTPKSDCYAADIKFDNDRTSFSVFFRDSNTKNHVKQGIVEIFIPGVHNVMNTLAAISMADQLQVSFETITKALSQFRGVKRRFETKFHDTARNVKILDDYGHHPTEIMATLNAARNVWKGRIITIFQPHRYSRTQLCMEQFCKAFEQTDVLMLTDIYAAGEDPIKGLDSEILLKNISKNKNGNQKLMYVGDVGRAKDEVKKMVQPNDLVICLGAGSITKLSDQLALLLK
jgi:UDP-N-acetylmuramate--alanine ligase